MRHTCEATMFGIVEGEGWYCDRMTDARDVPVRSINHCAKKANNFKPQPQYSFPLSNKHKQCKILERWIHIHTKISIQGILAVKKLYKLKFTLLNSK